MNADLGRVNEPILNLRRSLQIAACPLWIGISAGENETRMLSCPTRKDFRELAQFHEDY